ncbi:hypothetical protein RRG08_009985 [Elysia crispata]|uniref:Profilin n=1 Tax=Elysia crispata TaxID=231223 RepID=A0AAE1EA32_9GAST|nr:hypothetical protein RRG08_009985 [Elysia crispata]
MVDFWADFASVYSSHFLGIHMEHTTVSPRSSVLAASGHQRSYGALGDNPLTGWPEDRSSASPSSDYTNISKQPSDSSLDIIDSPPQCPRMLELMTWSEIIESLQQEGNLKMAAVFDENSQQLAGTDGAMLGSEDAFSITRIMNNSPSTMIYGLFLGGNKFQCLTIDHNTLIGQAGGDVFVALRNRNLLICAVAGLSSTVSCLGIVRNFVGRLVAEGAPEASVPSLM